MNAALTLWHKHMRKSLLHGEEIFGMLLQPILWVLLFGIGMQRMMEVGSGFSAGLPDADLYITYILPGIVALTALGGAVTGGFEWLNERVRGIVQEYLVAPIPRLSILLGNALSTVTKSLAQSVVIFAFGLLMGAQVSAHLLGWLGGLFLLTAYGLGFSCLALAFASKTNSTGGYHVLIFLLNLPLLFLSNALYPLNTLPGWMQVGALLNPTSYVVSGLRQTVFVTGTQDSELSLWLCFVAVLSFMVLSMWVAYRAFQSAIE